MSELRPLTFGEVLDGALSMYRRHFRLFLQLSVVLLVVPVGLGAYYGHPLFVPRIALENPIMFMMDPVGAFTMIASIGVLYYLATLLLTAATVRVISDAYLSRAPSFKDALRLGRSRMWPLFLVGVAKFALLGVLFGAIVGTYGAVGLTMNQAGIGLAADLVTTVIAIVGLWFLAVVACGYGVTTQAVVLERGSGALKAFGRSWRLTKGFRFKVFGLGVIAFLLFNIIPSVILTVLGAVWSPATQVASLAVQVVTLLVPVVLSPAIACVFTLLYYDLRVRREAFDLQVLSQQLGDRLTAALSGVVPPPDSLRRALDEVFARPEYRWLERPGSVGEWAFARWQRLQEWLDGLAVRSPTLFALVLGGLIVVLVALLVHVAYVLVQVLRPSPSPTLESPRPPRPEDADARRAHAEELARAGRYVEALGHRFLASLLELERVSALTVHPAKTPAEYVGEARLDPTGRASLQALVRRLYGHLFGAEPCDERAYHEFGVAADGLVRHVAPG